MYRDYFNLFLKFYEDQTQKAKAILCTRQKDVMKFLEFIEEHSFGKMFVIVRPEQRISEIEAKNYNATIYNYFKEHPLDCDIDVFKALDDFNRRVMDDASN